MMAAVVRLIAGCSPQCRGLAAGLSAPSFWSLPVTGARSVCTGGRGGAEVRVVDLRSDTVTKPCEEMRRAMAEAEVGDDVFGEDPTVNKIQHHVAELLGTQDALFVTSGTMGNIISVMGHCRIRGGEVLLGDESHMYIYEQGSIAQVAGVFPRPIKTLKNGCLDLQDLESKIQHGYPDVHYAQTRLICLENSHNRMGGRVLPLSYMKEVRDLADSYGLKVHLDGARLINAAQTMGVEPAQIVHYCDSGLGAPVGSLVGGQAEFVGEARRTRKMLGGGMRQAGILAAAGLVALKHAQENVKLDHHNAKTFAKAVQELGSPLCSTDPTIVDSNIVLLTLADKLSGEELCTQLSEVTAADLQRGQEVAVKALAFSSRLVRLVWHRDISEQDTLRAIEKLKDVLQTWNTKYKASLP